MTEDAKPSRQDIALAVKYIEERYENLGVKVGGVDYYDETDMLVIALRTTADNEEDVLRVAGMVIGAYKKIGEGSDWFEVSRLGVSMSLPEMIDNEPPVLEWGTTAEDARRLIGGDEKSTSGVLRDLERDAEARRRLHRGLGTLD
jgi:hypothetical protein